MVVARKAAVKKPLGRAAAPTAQSAKGAAVTTRKTYLRRYTDLTALFYMLSQRQITLLDPKSWDDTNDSHFLSIYKERKKLQSVLALCLSRTSETYHHWRVFSQGPSGVCIVFDRAAILQKLKSPQGVIAQDVEYFTLVNAKKKAFKLEELPFAKRAAFRHEREFRIVFESRYKVLPSINIPFELDCIHSISLSPWLHKSIASATVAAIGSIVGCEKMKVSRSTLIANEQWKAMGKGTTL